MHELSKTFVFDAAHTLKRDIDREASRRMHGHSYWVEITLRGEPDARTGMVIDLGIFERILEETRLKLDHHFLDEIDELGQSTIENLCAWIWKQLQSNLPLLYKVSISRKSSNDRCIYYGPLNRNR